MTKDEYRQTVLQAKDRLHTYVAWMLADRDEVLDVTQDALLRLWQNRERVSAAAARAWLLRTAHRLCVDRFRRRPPSGETALAAVLATTISSNRSEEPEEAAVVSELRPLVARALAELTPVDRAVIVLREIEGLRYGAIGDALGRSTENIKVTLHRARKRLREHLLAVVQR